MNKKTHLTILISLFSLLGIAQTNNFNEEPWKKDYPIIIDPYQGNDLNFEKLATDKKLVAIIHKASQGFIVDKKYIERSVKAKANNFLYASYHLGTNEDPIKQADFYLKTIQNHTNEPMALDIENCKANPENKPFITLPNAEKFINRIFEKTGKYPFLYINDNVYKQISKEYNKKSVFAKCPLWYARFKSKITDLNSNVWDKISIWQFSSEINCKKKGECLYNIPGTNFDIDVNAFNGDLNSLNTLWASYKNNNNSNSVDDFIKQNLKNSIRFKKNRIAPNSQLSCGYSEVYFVEGFNADDELKDRQMVYKKDGKYILSNNFIKWCAEQIDFYNLPEFGDIVDSTEKEKALNNMEISFSGISEFHIDFHSKIPENIPDSPIGKYVTFMNSKDILSYDFPTKNECEK
jgi:GH25 family lysozyme M1 (1,4-beta-N-acetylmuramidase)